MTDQEKANAIEREWYQTVPDRTWKRRTPAMRLLLDLLRDEGVGED